MSLLAEELVEEWLNRQGYFTIRGARIGVHEMDLLAIKPGRRGHDCRHIEVQASVRPIGYVSAVSKQDRKRTGRSAGNAARRSPKELRASVSEWIAKKYDLPQKEQLRRALCAGEWSRELVVNVIRHEDEIVELERQHIQVHRLNEILRNLADAPHVLASAVSGDVLDLMTVLSL